MAEITNPPVNRLARVISAKFSKTRRLASAGEEEASVTAAEDLEGITTAVELAERLTLVDEAGSLLPGPWVIFEFDAPEVGLDTPVVYETPGFVGRGRTAGGARKFVVPNAPISDLQNVTIREVP